MFNSNDIYRHLMNGGKPENLHKALDIEIEEANKKVAAAREEARKEQERTDKKNKARTAAFKALKAYYAFANPDVTDEIINSILDTLESVEIKINGVRGKGNTPGSMLFNFFENI
jgi:hypothetical protein